MIKFHFLRKGFSSFLFLVLLALFALASAVFFIANVLLAEEHQEELVSQVQSLDDEVTLQALLRFPYQGKELHIWLVSGVLGNKDHYQSFVKGFHEYFQDSRQYVIILIFLHGRQVHAEDYTRAWKSVPQEYWWSDAYRDVRPGVIDMHTRFQAQKYHGRGAAEQLLPYDIKIHLVQAYIPEAKP